MPTIELEYAQIDKIVVTELKEAFNAALGENDTLLTLSVAEVLKYFMTNSEHEAWRDSLAQGG